MYVSIIQARGHLVSVLDPLGITYADLHAKIKDIKNMSENDVNNLRKCNSGTNIPSEVVVRQHQHMLGEPAAWL